MFWTEEHDSPTEDQQTPLSVWYLNQMNDWLIARDETIIPLTENSSAYFDDIFDEMRFFFQVKWPNILWLQLL